MDNECHSGCMLLRYSIWIGGSIIKKLVDSLFCGLCCTALFRGESAKRYKHGWVHSMSIIEERSDGLMYAYSFVVAYGCRAVGWFR